MTVRQIERWSAPHLRSADNDIVDTVAVVVARRGDACPGIVVAVDAVHSYDFYNFVAENGGKVFVDIDNSFDVDTLVNVHASVGTRISRNDYGNLLNPGSAKPWDSYLTVDEVEAGEKILVEVGTIGEAGPRPASYDLNISLATSRVTAGSQLLVSRPDGGSWSRLSA